MQYRIRSVRTISHEEFARCAPVLREILPPEDLWRVGRRGETVTMKAIIRRLRRLEEDRVVRQQEEGFCRPAACAPQH
jgi:hypothetical protein